MIVVRHFLLSAPLMLTLFICKNSLFADVEFVHSFVLAPFVWTNFSIVMTTAMNSAWKQRKKLDINLTKLYWLTIDGWKCNKLSHCARAFNVSLLTRTANDGGEEKDKRNVNGHKTTNQTNCCHKFIFKLSLLSFPTSHFIPQTPSPFDDIQIFDCHTWSWIFLSRLTSFTTIIEKRQKNGKKNDWRL